MSSAAEQVFFLKWSNFQTHILTVLESLQVTEDLADVTLTCEGHNIKAHKFILSVCSPYFRNIFKENPCSHPIVILKDVMYQDLIAILNFMYQGEATVEIEQLSTFYQTAELLQVSGLNDIEDIKSEKQLGVVKPVHDDLKRLKSSAQTVTKVENIEVVCVEETIKTEIDEDYYDVNVDNYTQKKDISYEKSRYNSLLDAALEVRDSLGILEKSKTYDKDYTSSTESEIYVRNKPPDEYTSRGEYADKEISDTAMMELNHSSQCQNCPHCGKTYTNQSALKYQEMDEENKSIDAYARQRDLANARMRKYRKRQNRKSEQLDYMKDEKKDIRKQQTEEERVQQRKKISRECSRRYRAKKRMKALEIVDH